MNTFNKTKTIQWIGRFWGDSINPKRDWIILITIFLVSVVFFILLGLNIYRDTNSKELFVDISKEEIIIEEVKPEEMSAVISVFEKKKTMFNSVKTIKLVDPSL